MWTEWITVEAELELLSPLHVGSGAARRMDKPPEGRDEAPELALTMTDVDGRPCIPGASIKGALRAAARDRGDDLSGLERALLGGVPLAAADDVEDAPDPKKERRFVAGGVQFRTARLVGDPAKGHGARGGDKLGAGAAMAERGLEVAARTAIDEGAGVAAEHKLFHEQVAAPGQVFGLRLRIDLPKDEAAPEAVAAATGRLLSPFAADDGAAIGGGATYGMGRLKIRPGTIAAVRHWIGKDDEDISAPLIEALAADPAPRITRKLTLACDGPFVVIDSAASSGRRKGKTDQGDVDPHLVAMGRDGKPVLPGESLHGVLRQRALWLARLRDRDHKDRRFTPLRDIDKDDAPPLTATEKLFGVAGLRGRLSIDRVAMTGGAEAKDITSVKLDRFSGAPIDGGLFTTTTWLGAEFDVTLSLDPRAGGPTPDVVETFENLVEDLKANGIELGHGAAKGFGWFEVTAEETEDD